MPDLTLTQIGIAPLWRVFGGHHDVKPGTAKEQSDNLVWSVSPGEWTILGPQPHGHRVVDLTHVRAPLRLTGPHAHHVLAKICALDLNDDMFPHLAAARTPLAQIATELIRQDHNETRSYLIVPSRSFSHYLHHTLTDAGNEYGLVEGVDT